jgi:hypothetical protein
VEIHDAKSHDIIVQQHGAMTLDVVLLYNTMSFGSVLGVYFWDFPQGPKCRNLTKNRPKCKNFNCRCALPSAAPAARSITRDIQKNHKSYKEKKKSSLGMLTFC